MLVKTKVFEDFKDRWGGPGGVPGGPASSRGIYEKNVGESIKKKLLSYSVDLNELVNSKKFLNKKLLFEGAQGLMLDIDYGTFPYVTSSNTLPANAASSIGLNHKKLGHILGIVKNILLLVRLHYL